MPTTSFRVSGSDLDTLFEPIGASSKRADVSYTVSGTDISNYYYSVSNGGTAFGTTNLKAGGVDIGTLFAAAGSVVLEANFLHTWGRGSSGQGGLNDTNNRSTPTQVGTLSWYAVSSGGYHCLAIRSDRKLFSWGSGSDGALGDGTTVSKSSPIQIGSSSWNFVSAGTRNSAAIRSDNALFTWGYNSGNWGGSLGHNTLTSVSSPVQVAGSWSKVDIDRFTLAINTSGQLFSWGYGGDGALGQGSTPTYSWFAVSAGLRISFGIRSDRMLFGWGSGSYGQMGQGNTLTYYSPVQIGASSWNAVSAGINGRMVAAIRSDQKLFTWGRNTFGQLGLGDTTDRSSPVQVNASSWAAVSAGDHFMLARRSDSRIFAWGRNNNGQLGQSDTFNRYAPTQIGTSLFSQIAAGEDHCLAIRGSVSGSLWTWGRNTFGELGSNSTTNRSSPVQVGISTNWLRVYAGRAESAAITTINRLFVWGRNNYGQLGLNDLNNRSSPTQLGTSSWTSVDLRFGGLSFGIRLDGALFAWGSNVYGGFGNGTSTSTSSPVQIGSNSWSAIAAGLLGPSLGITNNLLYSWGGNASGQLGQGDNVNRSSPTLVAGSFPSYSSPVQIGSSTWTQVSVGNLTAAAIRSDQKLFMWGNNSNGVLGDGTTVNKSSPVQIGTSNWSAVSVSQQFGIPPSNFTLALTADKRMFSWGSNQYGQLGQNDLTNRSSPVQIGSSSWNAITSGRYHAHAIRSDYKLFSWGRNNFGQLGQNDLTNRSSPTQVGTMSWAAVSSHADSNVGLNITIP